jgi:transcriptional regulator with XRE-family HTH domain
METGEQEEARLVLEGTRERPNQIFARRVKEIREDRRPRMTQADLARRVLKVQGMLLEDPVAYAEDHAKRIEVARVMISRTESGARVATVDDLIDFAQALEVPPGALLEGSGGIDALSDLEGRMRKMREDFSQIEASLRAAEKARDLLARAGPASAPQLEQLDSALQPEPLKEKKR